MTKNEILEAASAICFGPTDNSIISASLDKLSDALPQSKIIDLVFWNSPELTPEQIVDEAMKRQSDYEANHDLGSN